MDRRAWAVAAVAPFVTLTGVLKQVPSGASAMAPMPWAHAVLHASVLLGLMAAHAWCYARWTPHAPNRMLVNEFLARLWFVLFGLLVVGGHGEQGWLYLLMAAPWAVASWCTHFLALRSQGRYHVAANVGMLGLFLLGLALMGLLTVRLGLA